jgi:hypothetical protein
MDTFWIVLGITGALGFVYLLADKASRRMERRDREELEMYESCFEDDDRR